MIIPLVLVPRLFAVRSRCPALFGVVSTVHTQIDCATHAQSARAILGLLERQPFTHPCCSHCVRGLPSSSEHRPVHRSTDAYARVVLFSTGLADTCRIQGSVTRIDIARAARVVPDLPRALGDIASTSLCVARDRLRSSRTLILN